MLVQGMSGTEDVKKEDMVTKGNPFALTWSETRKGENDQFKSFVIIEPCDNLFFELRTQLAKICCTPKWKNAKTVMMDHRRSL